MKQYIRKADIILLIVLVAVGLAVSAALALSHTEGGRVIIESGGELYATYSLYEDRTVEVPAPDGDDFNTVTISGGTVSVTEASCRNQVCVHHSPISMSGESIVCLPNRLIVRIESGSGGGYDSISS